MTVSNEIPLKHQRPLHIAVMGTWNWLDVAAELIRRAGMTCETVHLENRKAYFRWFGAGELRRFDAIHHVCGGGWLVGAAAAMIHKPVIWHWIGMDVTRFADACRDRWVLRNALARRSALRWARGHLADSPKLVEELAPLGIQAQVVRLLPKAIEAPLEPLPEKHCVLSYWDTTMRDYYYAPTVMQLAESFPDTPFLIVGDKGEGMKAPPNVKFLGRLPTLADVYSQTSIYVRLVKHDSLSAIVLESLARGRYVIYSEDFPFTRKASNLEEARTAMAQLLLHRTANQEGSDYVKTQFSITEQVQRLGAAYGRWFNRSR